MIKNDINWTTIDNKLKKLKYPLVFIFSIIKNQHKINDNDLTLIIRFFFKNQVNLTLKYPLFAMINLLDESFVNSKKVVSDFYLCILKKFFFYKLILKLRQSFNKEEMNNLNFYEQKAFLENMLLIFRANFDSSITGLSGATKFISQLKIKGNDIIANEIKNRVNTTLDLLGIEFFKNFNIKLIKASIYKDLPIESKIKYLLYYYLKVEKTFQKVFNIYELFKIFDNKIKQIINPRPISINFDNTFSENDSEDIMMIMQS